MSDSELQKAGGLITNLKNRILFWTSIFQFFAFFYAVVCMMVFALHFYVDIGPFGIPLFWMWCILVMVLTMLMIQRISCKGERDCSQGNAWVWATLIVTAIWTIALGVLAYMLISAWVLGLTIFITSFWVCIYCIM